MAMDNTHNAIFEPSYLPGDICDLCLGPAVDCVISCGSDMLFGWAAGYLDDATPYIPSHYLNGSSLRDEDFLTAKDDPLGELQEIEGNLREQPIRPVWSRETEQPPAPSYRRHTKTKAQVKLLKEWYDSNPNPTVSQLYEYAKLSGLEKDQVRHWFVNRRRPGRGPKTNSVRKESGKTTGNAQALRSVLKDASDREILPSRPIPIPESSRRLSMTESLRSLSEKSESMLDRWRNSPPDEEPASFAAVKHALAAPNPLETIIFDPDPGYGIETASNENINAWRGPPSTHGSAASSGAKSLASSASRSRRKHKEAFRRNSSVGERPSASLDVLENHPFLQTHPLDTSYSFAQISLATQSKSNSLSQELSSHKSPHICERYICSCCTLRFNTEEEWREHEILFHDPQAEWVCSLEPFQIMAGDTFQCQFCQKIYGDFQSFREHPCFICGLSPGSSSRPCFKTLAELNIHVEGFHGVFVTSFMIERWHRPPSHPRYCNTCKICRVDCGSWERRLDHTARHFTASFETNPCTCLSTTKTLELPKHDVPKAPGILSRVRAWITRKVKVR